MDTLAAFAMGEANRGKALMVFDWNRAAELIAERKPAVASAGLSGDWEYTGGRIYEGGKPVPEHATYTYLASTWATPELDMDGETVPCFLMEGETDGWDATTYWPESAAKFLNR